MKQITTILLAGITALFMSACGGGSTDDGISTVNNSVFADEETYLGYYGAEVVFGNHTVARQWKITTPNQPEDVITLTFPTDSSEGLKLEDGEFDVIDFGVSQDAKSMQLLQEDQTQVLGIYLRSVSTDSCYNGYLKNLSTNDILDITICAGISTSSASAKDILEDNSFYHTDIYLMTEM